MARIKIGNFKGPKGDTGAQGATGPVGPEGKQGPVGPAGGVNSVNGGQGDVVIGGANLIKNSTGNTGDTSFWSDNVKLDADGYAGHNCIICERSGYSGSDVGLFSSDNIGPHLSNRRGEKITVSGYYYIDSSVPLDSDDGTIVVRYDEDGALDIVIATYDTKTERNKWIYFQGSGTVTSKDFERAYVAIRIKKNGKIRLSCLKAELGTVATDWSPAPEDLAYKWQTEGVLPHRYVVRWDKAQNTMTRMYDAAGITTDTTHFAYHGSVDAAYDNPFDKLYPWSHRKLCKADKAKYKELYEAGGDVMGAITKWEGEPGFALGGDGMDMVYTPEFWMRQWEDGGYVYIGVADGPIYGWQYVPEMVTGRYLASDDGNNGLTSRAGDVPLADTVSVAQLHTKAKTDHLTLDTIQTWDPETVLMVVEYANMNCQTAIGQSVSSLYWENASGHPKANGSGNTVVLPSAIKPYCIPGAILDFGTTQSHANTARRVVKSVADADSGYVTVTFDGSPVTYTTGTFCAIHGLYNAPDEQIGSKSGYIGENGKSLAYYRGRNCYGNCYHYLLGAYRESGTGHIWVAPDEETADELDALDKSKCIDTGCALPQGASGAQGEGYIKELHLLPDYPMAPFCKTTGGDSAKPVGDYVWTPALSTADTICIAGASASNGLNVGRFSAYWRNASSHAWWSSAASLAFKKPQGGV